MADGSMTAETIKIRGNGGDEIDAYYVQPAGAGPFPGVVVVQHIFGVDEWIKEVCRKLAHHGYAALAPNLYARIGSLGAGPVEDLAARLRSLGGLNDNTVAGDMQGAVDHLRAQSSNSGKIGIIGFCMGGRFAYLAACKVNNLDAAVDCWGGGVAPLPGSAGPPGAPVIDLTDQMDMPILGIFGNDDTRPDVDEVNRTEEKLRSLGKTYEFHRYDGAGHGFFATDRPSYRQQQATDAWSKVFSFYEKYLTAPVAAGVR
ncbi:MAG TPA: dienelactone hydrolase family protein [Dehalococcoidia bacterium]|nr:dienelactone hydrolase family protein [Dehalococcoidia bacterium]